ncbi:MAG: hypothetical protein A2725_03440 [Candidatus Magasanikbacteria bacterium RIFCSPHIGHO2_01_FULL_33_34]|uniref:Uncharacterized protein n=1 Tax=Candidatus Magasanikbacteria bacterium RIFCSPHIGHO2_01_FULL_33_34 TaxID=1798671 RepID=A0A1F6LHE9_9BACT|nr:MAG: hypothetical protein A2725_03440 [Candidatus Magasanikbacteria bacterium RIFCSPHIGHO2_01_FULL_33_34]OGH66183.1 MAG: hypothetical protein A3B83_00930 [Candidatus Magasanikbacteria bacterium RIFCSPHIGHO2_02_FULL_33_17]OGH76029.1 MAG: hypothetical protein A3A89_00840 [Candidatus Magasanikbacteria bacterium RIFCSPLOWO2_01_FULL_33_34]
MKNNMNFRNILSKIKLKKSTENPTNKNSDSKSVIKDKRNRPIFILRLLSYFVIFLLLLAIMLTVIFVHSSITNSIGQIESIASYQNKIHIELIDFNALEKTEEYWQEKVKSELTPIERNPFLETIIEVTTTTELLE